MLQILLKLKIFQKNKKVKKNLNNKYLTVNKKA